MIEKDIKQEMLTLMRAVGGFILTIKNIRINGEPIFNDDEIKGIIDDIIADVDKF